MEREFRICFQYLCTVPDDFSYDTYILVRTQLILLLLRNVLTDIQCNRNNYNQTVKAVKSNFGEKRAFALLRNLEKATIDLVVLSKRIIMLTREFEEEYLIKRKKEEQQNGG